MMLPPGCWTSQEAAPKLHTTASSIGDQQAMVIWVLRHGGTGHAMAPARDKRRSWEGPVPLLRVEAQVVDAVALGGHRKVARRFPELAGILQGANFTSSCSTCAVLGTSAACICTRAWKPPSPDILRCELCCNILEYCSYVRPQRLRPAHRIAEVNREGRARVQSMQSRAAAMRCRWLGRHG